LISETNFTFDASNNTAYLSGKLGINITGASNPLQINGTSGELFTVTDDLTSSLLSVNNIAGLPVLEVFASNAITAGQFGSGDFIITGNKVGIGTTTPSARLHTSGSVRLQAIASATGAAVVYIDGSGNLTSGVAPQGGGGGGSVTLSGPNNGIVTRDGAAGTTLIAETNYEFNAATRLMYLSGQIGINFTGNTGAENPLKIHGTGGELFSIDDDLSSSLMSVNTIAGLPVFEAFADSTVQMGQYGSGDFIITGNNIGVGTTTPRAKLEVLAPVNTVGVLDYVSFNRQTSNYTLVSGDAGKIIEMNLSTPNTGTVPLNSSVAFRTGTKIDIVQYGSGVTTVTGSAGVTLRTANNYFKINARYGVASLVKVGTDEWYLFGNLGA
jgi:hypothetical protein